MPAVARTFLSLFGGIGNLLFQYAAAREVAAQGGGDVVLVQYATGTIDRLQHYIGPVEFDVVDRVTCRALGAFVADPASRVGRLANVIGRTAVDGLVRTDVGSHAAMPARGVSGSRFLHGYFQHPTWFGRHVDDVLLRLARHRPALVPGRLEHVVGVHLRRGDFVRAGWALPLGYYLSALRAARASGHSGVFVASDDSMARSLLEERLAGEGWDVVRGEEFGPASAFGDFHLLGSTGALVLSNSSFSWWAARLNEHRAGADVGPRYAPDRWVDGADHLLDERWITIA